jgi:hypothetical protein
MVVESTDFRWTLHLHSGVAVLDLEGEWDDSADHLLSDAISRLIGSGHLEIIVNLTHADGLSLTETRWLDGLEKLAGMVRARRGRLDVVGARPLTQAAIRTRMNVLYGWAASEEEALCHIYNLPMVAGGQKLVTRLA